MADVASALQDWSASAGNNAPSGSTSIGTGLAPNLREIQKVVRQYLANAVSDVASATTTDVGAAGSNYVRITGTTPITGLGTVSAGIWKWVRFADVLILTHNASSLILKHGQNHLTTAGDVMGFVSEGSGNWREMFRCVAGGDFPPGTVMPDAGTSAPDGWLHCYGQAISRTTYSAIFARLSTTYGTGDGSTTFNLPDLRGRAPFGKDNMGGSAASRITSGNSGITGTTLGASGGSELLQQHSHSASWTYATSGSGSQPNIAANGSNSAGTVSVSVANAGSGSSQNMPPALIVNYIIKT